MNKKKANLFAFKKHKRYNIIKKKERKIKK